MLNWLINIFMNVHNACRTSSDQSGQNRTKTPKTAVGYHVTESLVQLAMPLSHTHTHRALGRSCLYSYYTVEYTT